MSVTVDFDLLDNSIDPEELRLVQLVFGDLLGELLVSQNQNRG